MDTVFYLLKANLCLAALFVLYGCLFSRDTFLGWKRVTLWMIPLMSFLIPWADIPLGWGSQEAVTTLAVWYGGWVEASQAASRAVTGIPSFTWEEGVIVFYGAGVALLAFKFLVRLVGIIALTRRCARQMYRGRMIHVLPSGRDAFSFFGRIYLNPSAHSVQEADDILAHEEVHGRQWHSIDLLMGEVVCMACWFNPFAWRLRRAIRMNLEFLADRQALRNVPDGKAYQYHLLGMAQYKAAANLYTNFYVSPVKQRIMMMNKQRTSSVWKAKYLVFLPVTVLMMAVCRPDARAAAPGNPAATSAFAAAVSQDKADGRLCQIIVTRNDEPMEGFVLRLDGEEVVTDKSGMAEVKLKGNDTLSGDNVKITVSADGNGINVQSNSNQRGSILVNSQVADDKVTIRIRMNDRTD